MERKLSFTDVTKTVEDAYEKYKSIKEGTVDARVAGESRENAFGISVVLTDGRVFTKGDTEQQVSLGPVAKVPLSVVLLSQNSADALAKKGACCGGTCKCGCAKFEGMPFGKHGLRAVSAVVPQGDPDGKFSVISDMIYALSSADQGFNDNLYKYLSEKAKAAKIAEQLTEAGYKLYDDAAQSIDVYSRLLAVRLSVTQTAAMGATIAADGRNPESGEYAFDGSIAASVVALMATRGKHFIKPWMVETGLPAKKSYTGLMLAVLPGFGAIAAYSPELDESGVPVKAAAAIKYIAQTLGLNVYASARVSVEK